MKNFIVAIILFVFAFISSYCFADCNIKMFNVGHGDSILIQTDTENILVDTGALSARSKLNSELNHLTIHKLILTHPHADHIANAKFIVDNFRCNNIYDNGVVSSSNYYKNYINSGASITHLSKGDIIYIDSDTALEIYNPDTDYVSINDSSLVFKLTYKNFKMLFTGDAQFATESLLTNIGKVDVLKSPHHGSKTSSTLNFIQSIRPDTVIISADGSYNFPHAESLNSYVYSGVSYIYCTKYNGDISIHTDGYTYTTTPEYNIDWLNPYLDTLNNNRVISAINIPISN